LLEIPGAHADRCHLAPGQAEQSSLHGCPPCSQSSSREYRAQGWSKFALGGWSFAGYFGTDENRSATDRW
jgi:hypothetical protein